MEPGEMKQYEVYWINLNPVKGSEMAKTRPCVILSPDEMNRYLNTIIIAPLTHTLKDIPSRVRVCIDGQDGDVCLDHIRSISKDRVGACLGELSYPEIRDIKDTIMEMLVD